jgi:hypothetical protein
MKTREIIEKIILSGLNELPEFRHLSRHRLSGAIVLRHGASFQVFGTLASGTRPQQV